MSTTVFFILFGLAAGVIALVMVTMVVAGVLQWSRNNRAPQQTLAVMVATKRSRTSGGVGDTAASTSYYVTFEEPDGRRFELPVTGRDYGLIAERDRGLLTCKGTRFLGFARTG